MRTAIFSPRYAYGFSFIELLASVAIIGFLASIAVPVAETTVKRSKEAELRKALRDIRGAIDSYRNAVRIGQIASTPQASGYPTSLQDLVSGTDDKLTPRRKIYFLRRLPRDPFHVDQTTPAIATWGKRSFDSPPDNPREGADVFDVYSLSGKRALNGSSYSEW